jgi:hypothetical protein
MVSNRGGVGKRNRGDVSRYRLLTRPKDDEKERPVRVAHPRFIVHWVDFLIKSHTVFLLTV